MDNLSLIDKSLTAVCPARGIDNMRIPRDWRPALNEDRLLVLSPFPATARRMTAALATQRNDLVADLAQCVLIAHAAPGGETEAFARRLAESCKSLPTLDSLENASVDLIQGADHPQSHPIGR